MIGRGGWIREIAAVTLRPAALALVVSPEEASRREIVRAGVFHWMCAVPSWRFTRGKDLTPWGPCEGRRGGGDSWL